MTTTKPTSSFADQSASETIAGLNSDVAQGLTFDDAKQRLQKYGPNTIEEKEEPLWHRIFTRFWGPIPWMIEAAAILSAVVQKWEDFSIILVMLLLNAFLDFIQEHKALNALKTLKKGMNREVLVKRAGEFLRIPIGELVPGDIVKLKIGDLVPADVQLLEGEYLSIDQAALTGESLPVTKQSNDIAYANTIVKQGEMLAVVVNTGMRTDFSSVVSLVAKAELEQRSHFQKMVIQIGNFLILITIALVLLIIMVSLFRGDPLLEIVRFALVLTVAAIPVALPAVLSVTMTVGAVALARHRAIVSRLTAIEELAGVDVFCTDKTGTLTSNEMHVVDPVLFADFSEEDLFLTAALASRWENNDPIELPIFKYLEQHFPGLDWRSYENFSFVPFDPVSKRTEAEVEIDGERVQVVKGAAQVLMDMAGLTDDQAREMTGSVAELAGKGYRTLAVGIKRSGKPLTIIGLIPMFDPPREDSQATIEALHSYGVQVKMVTGDNMAIAMETGRRLGLKQRTMNSAQLAGTASHELMDLAETLAMAIYQRLKGDASLQEAKSFATDVMEDVNSLYDTRLLEHEFIHTHESAIIEMIEEADIFAEVVPADKYRITDTLQKGGHIVAMTGDGVNDAPALKKADCGFAVSNATDAARAAADIILTAPGLSVIEEAVKQARITFARMKSYATFRIAETIRIILFMTLSIVIFDFYPITALMIILLALLNDIPILAIAYDNTKVHQQPVRWNMRELLTVSSVLGVVGVISSFLLFYILRERGFDEDLIQSLIFLKLIVAGHSTLYITRSEGWFWQRPWPSPLLMAATFGTEIAGTLIAVEGIFVTAIGWEYAAWIWLYAIVWFILNDVVKMWTYKMLRRWGATLLTAKPE